MKLRNPNECVEERVKNYALNSLSKTTKERSYK